ncbi:UPF0182 family protein [Aeromicrobium sp. UC242_57]|uniref:UPF0182 family protein n=1 Tax=Aeromicrobium sp. UC242_57 TaxID=3374624 RepID=UPI00379E4F03
MRTTARSSSTEWDTKDPVLKTWMKVFPGAVESKSKISDALLEHLRYPVDLFKVQRDVLQRYHVTDAQTFYEDGERWKVPEDPTAPTNSGALQPPYYLSMARPGEDTPKFSVTSVYLPNKRQNLEAFVSVNSEATDTENYGKMQILQLSSSTQIDGPSQIANKLQTDNGVTQALLPFKQSGTEIQYGNLLTLPVGGGLLYVQPVYIKRQASEGTYPVLQYVIASFGKDVGFGQTLDEALRVALGLEPGSTTDPESESEEPPVDPGTKRTASELLDRASGYYDDAQDALKDGDLALYQRRIDQMNDAITQAKKLVDAAAAEKK